MSEKKRNKLSKKTYLSIKIAPENRLKLSYMFKDIKTLRNEINVMVI